MILKDVSKYLFYFMSMSVLPACIYVQSVGVWCLNKSEEGTEPLFMDDVEPPSGRWKLNLGPNC